MTGKTGLRLLPHQFRQPPGPATALLRIVCLAFCGSNFQHSSVAVASEGGVCVCVCVCVSMCYFLLSGATRLKMEHGRDGLYAIVYFEVRLSPYAIRLGT